MLLMSKSPDEKRRRYEISSGIKTKQISVFSNEMNVEQVRLYQKVESATSAMEFFSTRGWQFSHNNATHLLEKMSVQDRRLFYFDVRQIDWNSYLEKYVLGVRQFVMKEDPDTLPKARKQLVRSLAYSFAYCHNPLRPKLI